MPPLWQGCVKMETIWVPSRNDDRLSRGAWDSRDTSQVSSKLSGVMIVGNKKYSRGK